MSSTPVLMYYEYLGPDDDRGGRTRYFCGSCRCNIGGVYGSACFGHPGTIEELEEKNSTPFFSRDPIVPTRVRLGTGEVVGDPLRYYAFCPWCGVEFEDEWWRDRTIQNERAIDHFCNPGFHKGDRHEFRGFQPVGHWLAVTGGDRVCWCEPEIEPGIMGCTIRHRDIPMP